MEISKLKLDLLAEVERIQDRMEELSTRIHNNPEISFEEFKAVTWLTSELAKHGFTIEHPVADLETAFKAGLRVAGASPVICLLAEYDALPGLGHACGHDLSGVASITAAIAVSKLMKSSSLDGTILVMGTPGEELYSGKATLVERGVFGEVDAAMMAHMCDENVMYPSFLALDAVEFSFQGKASHAAAAPHKGINALDAVQLTFQAVNALRQHVRDGVRIHGIITNGGEAPNIVPDKAAARFYVRANERSYLNEVTGKVRNCARGAAIATGATLEITAFEPSLDDLISNRLLGSIFKSNWEYFTSDIKGEVREGFGSSDVGNVSHMVPTIHPMIAMAPAGVARHTKEFCEAGGSERGRRALLVAAKTLGMTVIDLLTAPDSIREMQEELRETLGD